MTIYCFDIDGTLCSDTDGEYKKAKPHADAIHLANDLYKQGHRIILLTARGSTTKKDWRALTEQQLQEWGVLYHELHFSKPTAHVYIDDKSVNAQTWVSEKKDPFLMLRGLRGY